MICLNVFILTEEIERRINLHKLGTVNHEYEV